MIQAGVGQKCPAPACPTGFLVSWRATFCIILQENDGLYWKIAPAPDLPGRRGPTRTSVPTWLSLWESQGDVGPPLTYSTEVMPVKRGRLGVSGALAGAVNGVFGGGGGMVLAPLLGSWCRVEEKRALANCVATILPCCVLSGGVYLLRTGLDWGMALPYLLGGLAGGFLGGKLFTKVPAVWLRRLFAAFLVYGGVRYLL